jgi:nitrite reductase (NO-forming)
MPTTRTNEDRAGRWYLVAVIILFAVISLPIATVGAVAVWKNGDSKSNAAGASPSSVALRLTEFAISPKQINIAIGGSLDVTNGGTMPHDLAVKGAHMATKLLAPAQSESLSLSGLPAGTYTVYCQVPGHEQLGMVATLVVGGVAGTPAAGSQQTPSTALSPAKPVTIAEISRHPSDLPDSPDYAMYKNNKFLDKTTRTGPMNHEVHFQIKEGVAEVLPGTTMDYWTFDGAVPGPMVRTRVGDTVDFFLTNPQDSQMPHNVDFHAVTGPGGGAVRLETNPGATSELKVKTLKPGIYIYHCAFPDIPTHISHGMYGLVVVEPAGGLPKVDHEYYVMQSEFYTSAGADKTVSQLNDAGHLDFSATNGDLEQPTFVVFNGRPNAVTGERSLGVYNGDKITTGQSVRLFVGDIGPNLISSFHVIGEIFDTVYVEGSFSLVNHDVQTTLVPSGGAVGVEFTIEVPGDYLMVDHAIYRALHKGANGIIHVEGPPNPDVYNPVTSSNNARGGG